MRERKQCIQCKGPLRHCADVIGDLCILFGEVLAGTDGQTEASRDKLRDATMIAVLEFGGRCERCAVTMQAGLFLAAAQQVRGRA